MFENKLTATDFEKFFADLWGKTPFPWQTVLARRVLEQEASPWPQAITLPTASGKTACLDIALFALAAQAERQERGEPFTAPRRIFFVVDRRVIVNEAFERARRLAAKLQEAKGGVLLEVKQRLRYLAGGGDEQPLACFQLRGGIYRDDAWARTPLQPTIIASTVDQFGSRLLFRGYGRRFKAWPIHAGLAGNDSLILLDEAHCAQPFMETLNAVAKYRQWAETPLFSPFHLVVMTATPPESVTDRFPDAGTEQDNLAHPVLGDRIKANKPCRLVVSTKAQGKDAGKINQALAEKLVTEAAKLIKEFNGVPAVAIFCNRVDTARRAHILLAKDHGDNAILLTGRMRPLDKDDTIAGKLSELVAGRSDQTKLAAPLFVVATQTLEVGANLDFDLMVSECADLSALRQRFGRLNRMGRPVRAQGVIVIRADQEKEGAESDPVYGLALAATWAWLRSQEETHGQVDMGIAVMGGRLPADLSPFTMQPPHAPVMLPAHVDALVQTAPVPCPSPDVALFLHGPQAGPADVQVCWRADLNTSFDSDEKRNTAWIEAVTLCPPATGELMPVPFVAFRRWLAGEAVMADSGDVEGVETDSEFPETRITRPVLRRLGREDTEIVTDSYAIRPGDVMVIPSQLKGWETFGHIPSESMIDQGDRAHRIARAQALLRLTPETMAGWPDSPANKQLQVLLGEAKSRLEQEPDALAEDLKAVLGALSMEEAMPVWLREIAACLAREQRLERGIEPHPCGGLVIKGFRRLPTSPEAALSFSNEDDATASGTVRIPLLTHLEGVAEFARHYTRHLPKTIAEDIVLAAQYHDLGKADPRFQALLHGGNRWVSGDLLAKSGDIPQGWTAYLRACRITGYPVGERHELFSLLLLGKAPELLAKAHDRDLVLHLIASHHGHCRPFAPVINDPDPQTVSMEFLGQTLSACNRPGLERLDSGVAERFWRLVRRYGWWSLAGLESVFMLSDHRRSEWEETKGNEEREND